MAVTTLRAWLLVALSVTSVPPLHAQSPDPQGAAARSYQEAVTLAESRGDCRAASVILARVSEGPDRSLAARALVYLGVCHERLGREDAASVYRRVIERFPDQRAAASEARRRLAALTPRSTRLAPTATLRASWPSRPRDLAMGGAAAADGRLMAGIDLEGDVALFDLRTGARLRRVARAGEGSVGLKPVPAPDGRGVAFTWTSPQGTLELRVARSEAAAPRTLMRGEPGEAFLIQDWPVQRHLLLKRTAPGGTVSLAMLDVETARTVATLTLPGDAQSSVLSPNGRYIALDEPEAGTSGRRVRVVAVADGTTTAVVDGPADDGPVAWAPAGDEVLFVSNRSGTVDLWALPVRDGRSSGPPRLLQRDLGLLIDLVGVTKDGSFHYNRQVGTVDVHVATLDPSGTAAGPVRPVVGTRAGGNLMPSFSADGRVVTFATQYPFSATLEEFSLVDGQTRPRPIAAGVARRPLWAPDGSALLVRGTIADARFGFLSVNPVTNEVRPVVTVPDNADGTLGPGGWSHDAQALVYVMADGVVRRHVLATGANEPWFRLPAGTRPVALAPSPRDGRVALVLAAAGTTRLSVYGEDGSSQDLVSVLAPGRILSAVWTPDATALLYAETRQGNGLATVMRVPAGGGVATSLGVTGEGLRDLAVSPRGGHLAWTAGWPRREPWVLEHVIAPRR